MFSMYDDDGLNFRSTIDNLYTVQQIAPSKRIKNNTDEKSDNKFESFYKGKINQEAKDKYKQIANLDTKVEIYHVEQIMSHTPFIINDTKTLIEAYEMMQENDIKQLLIRSDGSNHLKAMVTKSDILNYLLSHLGEKNIEHTPVSELSENKIVTTDPISDIRRVAQVMIDFNFNAIPVVDSEDNILGVVTRSDIVKAVANIPSLQIWA